MVQTQQENECLLLTTVPLLMPTNWTLTPESEVVPCLLPRRPEEAGDGFGNSFQPRVPVRLPGDPRHVTVLLASGRRPTSCTPCGVGQGVMGGSMWRPEWGRGELGERGPVPKIHGCPFPGGHLENPSAYPEGRYSFAHQLVLFYFRC